MKQSKQKLMNPSTVLLMLLVCSLSFSAIAHQPMQHECAEPIRPVDDQDDLHWQKFLDDIDTFQACINVFVERHQAESREHQNAARTAVESWNRFVKQSLNVPEDFPWPPPSDP